MKKNYLIAAGLLLACVWSMKNMDLSASKLAFAETSNNSNFVVTVNDPTDLVYVPGTVTYSVTYTLSRSPDAQTGSTTISLSNAVDSDALATATTTLYNTASAGADSGYTLLEHNLPFMKISGLLGEANDRSTLGAKQTTSANDNNVIKVGFGNSSGAFDANNRADNQASDRVLWGVSDLCTAGNAALTDFADRTAEEDGEVSFGGAAGANGGCLTTVHVNDRASAVSSVTDGLIFTFTKASS